MLQKIKAAWREFPSKFWIVVLATFIDILGATLVFPFFALYITARLKIGMTQAGVLLGLFSIAGLAGSIVGGALTDKFGRRRIVLFGLVFSASSAVSMGLVNELTVFYPLVMFVGLFSHVAALARQAMVADMLPEEQRAEGFSILRVVANLSWIIGPTDASSTPLAAFEVDDLDAAMARLKERGVVFEGVRQEKEARWTAFHDSGGNRLELNQFTHGAV